MNERKKERKKEHVLFSKISSKNLALFNKCAYINTQQNTTLNSNELDH